MNSVSQSKKLLQELGERMELPLVFDKHGQCLLIMDDHLMISIRQSQESWILYGMLGEFWHPDIDSLIYLFSLNQSLVEQGQGALAFDKSNNAILFLQNISLKEASQFTLYQSLENFVGQLETLMEHLSESKMSQARMQGTAFSPI